MSPLGLDFCNTSVLISVGHIEKYKKSMFLKWSMKKYYHFLSKKYIKHMNRIILILIIIASSLSVLWYYRMDLYLTDKYNWYIDMGSKNYYLFKYEKAMQYANRAQNLDFDRPEAHVLKGLTLRNMGIYSTAEKEFEALLKYDDKLIQVSYNYGMGSIRLKKGLVNESMQFYKKNIELVPFDYYSCGYVGLLCLMNNDLENALIYFNQSKEYIKVSQSLSSKNMIFIPNSKDKTLMKGRIYAGTGFTYLKKGMYEEAQKEFEKAESFSPGSVDFVRMMIS